MLHGTGRALLGARKKYYQKVKGTNPIAYWPMWEPSGSVSQDLILAAQNGAYTGVTLAQPGIGDGRTSPFFDGANDFNNVYSAAFAGRFNGSEGTVMAWARVANAGVWTDGSLRDIFALQADAGNLVKIERDSVNNRIVGYYRAGGSGFQFRAVAGLTTLDWMSWGVTWSFALDDVRFFLNGIQQGATLNGLGVWSGAIAAVSTLIGSGTSIPTNPWHGYLAHVAVWDRALTPAQIASLAVV